MFGTLSIPGETNEGRKLGEKSGGNEEVTMGMTLQCFMIGVILQMQMTFELLA